MKNKAPYISVCIPTYEMHGLGPAFLEESFQLLCRQTFKDFEVVVSDNAKTPVIKAVCDAYSNKLSVQYIKNNDPLHGMSSNVNNAILHARGKLLKILFLDDLLRDEDSLAVIADNFDLNRDRWLVTGYEHTEDGKVFKRPLFPKYNDNVYLGDNTIGSPSILTIKNDHPLLFDSNLKWLMDCDYYKRCYDTFGPPKVIRKIAAVIRTGGHQVTNSEATMAVRYTEYHYMLKKHARGLYYWRLKLESSLRYQLSLWKRRIYA